MEKLGKDKTTILIILGLVIVLGIWGVPKMSGYAINLFKDNEGINELDNQMSIREDQMTKVKLTTNHGEIVIELYSDMPITTGNFEKLVSEGFYNGVIFHRIINNFMIQGGDPEGTGMGGPGYNIKDEFTHAGGNKNNRYTISMANSGANTGGSQFFINTNTEGNNFLDAKHPAFGIVVEGKAVVNKIEKVQVGAQDKPVEDVVIEKAEVV